MGVERHGSGSNATPRRRQPAASASARAMTASLRLIRRILETEAAFCLSRLERLDALAGNALGLAWRQLDAGAIAQMARHRPGPAYNRLLGLRADLVAEIAPVLAWYEAAGVKAEVETVAAHTDPN